MDIKNSKTFWHNWGLAIVLTLGLVISTAVIEYLFGRILICKCGQVLLWYGNTYGSGNSQHITDWYTFSHIIHGIAIYGLLWLFARRLPAKKRFVLTILIECFWEILENSPIIIDRYRTVTASLDYVGDSIINSVSDILACAFGFVLAYKIPVKATFIMIIAMELFTGIMVRDNLSLNIIMLIKPLETIRAWQLDAPNVPENLKVNK